MNDPMTESLRALAYRLRCRASETAHIGTNLLTDAGREMVAVADELDTLADRLASPGAGAVEVGLTLAAMRTVARESRDIAGMTKWRGHRDTPSLRKLAEMMDGFADALEPAIAAALAARDAEIAGLREGERKLQRALNRWLPEIAGDDSRGPMFAAASEDALLLMGLCDETESYGHQIMQRAEAAETLVATLRQRVEAAEWIAVADRLPTLDEWPMGNWQQVLVYDPTSGVRIESMRPEWWNRIDARGKAYNGPTVTHWRFLPKEPAAQQAEPTGGRGDE